MKELNELRRVAGGRNTAIGAEIYKLCDAIERELAERWMELPVDAEGVPIRVGDVVEFGENRRQGIIKALNEFTGADGRYTVKGKYKGCDVVVDYAHHPTAARATIEAASNMPHGDILVVFQPLTFNRTKLLFEDYVTSLLPCKKILFGEIFSDRESDNLGISSKDIADEINKRGGDAEFFADKMDIIPRIDEFIKPGDIILILGPEDIRELGDILCGEA